MTENFKYIPVFRSRQQEIKVLREFDFGGQIYPLIEMIKEKDRKNRNESAEAFYSTLFEAIKANKIFLDLPVYLKEASNTQKDVIQFNREVILDLDARVQFFRQFAHLSQKVIPVVSSLLANTGETNTISYQVEALRKDFPQLAFRTFHNTFSDDKEELLTQFDNESDVLIYDLDKIEVTSPVVRKQVNEIKSDFSVSFKVMLRSAINEDVQNVKLEHGDIVAEANNSLIEMYDQFRFNAFGDYAGIKKDDLTSGGTISPGFILYDPYDNLFYGFKSEIKSLDEFENTIIPAVLESQVLENLRQNYPHYIQENPGIQKLEEIRNNPAESGKNQAKFKKISMDHYLYCMKVSIENGEQLPLSVNQ